MMPMHSDLMMRPFQFRTLRRGMGLALLSAAAVLATAAPASAEIQYPWCIMQGEYTPQSCTFMTAEQCRASLNGASYCDRNPRAIVLPPPPPKQRR
jgi:hypothetical protein